MLLSKRVWLTAFFSFAGVLTGEEENERYMRADSGSTIVAVARTRCVSMPSTTFTVRTPMFCTTAAFEERCERQKRAVEAAEKRCGVTHERPYEPPPRPVE